jgi:CheY-like chemotaxis protein
MPNRGHIIIINDNPVDADVLQELLENNGYRVDKKANGKNTLNNISEAKPNLILLGDPILIHSLYWQSSSKANRQNISR